jgi:hypothetical protein
MSTWQSSDLPPLTAACSVVKIHSMPPNLQLLSSSLNLSSVVGTPVYDILQVSTHCMEVFGDLRQDLVCELQ